MTPLRLLLVDDGVLVRSGLRVILESEPDLTVVGDAGTGREALTVASDTHPDVVLMDVRMPDMDGIAATRELVARDPQRPRVLVLTTFEDYDYPFRSLHAGASGSALKRADPDDLVDATGRRAGHLAGAAGKRSRPTSAACCSSSARGTARRL